MLGDPDSPRFVLWGGRLRPVPAGLLDLPVFDLMSIFGKIRAGLGALGFRPAAPEVSCMNKVKPTSPVNSHPKI